MQQKVKIIAVNAANERGPKYPVDQIVLTLDGIEGDVHAGTVRPVSMFNMAEAERFYNITGASKLEYGQFAENILFETEGEIDVKPFDIFRKDEVAIQVTQKGKPFHDRFREPGNYVMPREGIFCRVLSGGILKAGDELIFEPKVFQAKVITLSDRASRGIYEDKSGPAVSGILENYFKKLNWRAEIENIVIPDDEAQLRSLISELLENKTDLIITTGGTGIGPRDITPDVMQQFIKKEIPGIMEMIRWKYGIEKPAALISRALAGVHNKTLLFALPGSVRAVNEYMTEITKHLEHLFYMAEGIDRH
jgi:molybdenum cofactor synthesis domain-containing protein